MWTIVEFGLASQSAGTMPWFVGHESRSAFISLSSAFNQDLGSLLHDGIELGSERRSVYSLKPLTFTSNFKIVFPSNFRKHPVDGNVVFAPQASAVMSVALFDEKLASNLVTQLVTKAHGMKLSIKGYEFSIERISLSVVEPMKLLDDQPNDADEIDLKFITPTYFNPLRGDMKYKIIVPDLTLMLASQASLLHRTLGLSLPRPEELSNEIFLSGVDIKTPYIKEVNSEAPTGFVGWAKIRFKEQAKPETRKLIAWLLKIGEVTNIGGNRSGGYGVVKVKLNGKGEAERDKRSESNLTIHS